MPRTLQCELAAIEQRIEEWSHPEAPRLRSERGHLAWRLVSNRWPSVAMESTGVYWIPAYEILECRGFKVGGRG
jgi:hypothetical protein